jgi:hypothetical protein
MKRSWSRHLVVIINDEYINPLSRIPPWNWQQGKSHCAQDDMSISGHNCQGTFIGLPSDDHKYKVQNSGFQTIQHARELIKSLQRFSILKLSVLQNL